MNQVMLRIIGSRQITSREFILAALEFATCGRNTRLHPTTRVAQVAVTSCGISSSHVTQILGTRPEEPLGEPGA